MLQVTSVFQRTAWCRGISLGFPKADLYTSFQTSISFLQVGYFS